MEGVLTTWMLGCDRYEWRTAGGISEKKHVGCVVRFATQKVSGTGALELVIHDEAMAEPLLAAWAKHLTDPYGAECPKLEIYVKLAE